MQHLFSQNIDGLDVYYLKKGTECLSSRFKSFGLLLDQNQNPVAPGTTYLARDAFENLKQITDDAKEKRKVEHSFWISGNGGTALCAGEFAQTSFASKAANTCAPVVELPGGQRLGAGAGTLLEVTSRTGIIRVFVRDCHTEDSNDESAKEENIVYLGLFRIKRATLGSDELSTVANCRFIKDEFTNCSPEVHAI
jgi:hypothetical protein